MIVKVKDGFIVSFQKTTKTDTEYDNAVAFLNKKPEAPAGYYYGLLENLEWVLCKEAIVVECIEEVREEVHEDEIMDFIKILQS